MGDAAGGGGEAAGGGVSTSEGTPPPIRVVRLVSMRRVLTCGSVSIQWAEVFSERLLHKVGMRSICSHETELDGLTDAHR